MVVTQKLKYYDVINVKSVRKLKILNYSIVQSPSWAANWFAASEEIPRISRNPKVQNLK